jgi:hypothetical protein
MSTAPILTTADCLTLPIRSLLPYFKPGRGTTGLLQWSRGMDLPVAVPLLYAELLIGVPSFGHVLFELDTIDIYAPELWVAHDSEWQVGDAFERYSIAIAPTPCGKHGNGVRWMFLCPICNGGAFPAKHCLKLHIPRGAQRFGCRECHDLIYPLR